MLRNKKLLGAPGRTTRSKDATRGSWHRPLLIPPTLHSGHESAPKVPQAGVELSLDAETESGDRKGGVGGETSRMALLQWKVESPAEKAGDGLMD